MRRALRRAAQVFAAAGALGVVNVAPAQTTHAVGNGAPVVVTHTTGRGVSPTAAVGAMQVELAWLADKATFHHALAAHVGDGALTVSGYVPNEAIRAAALRVAREHSTLPIVDHLKINGNVSVPVNGAAADELTQQARALLADGLGDAAAALDVSARDDGTVTIKGALPTMEEKLAVSRKMRQVVGCAGVVNLVGVVGMKPGSAVVVAPPVGSRPKKTTGPGETLVLTKATGTPEGWSDRPVAAKRPPAVEEKPAQKAYVATGTIAFDDDAAPAKTAAVPAVMLNGSTDPFEPLAEAAAPKLKQAVEKVCGKTALEVQVDVQADSLMHVVVKVADVKTQLEITDRILTQVPEMALPNVRLDMQVAEDQ